MSGFIVGADRNQATLFPETLDDYVAEESATRVIDVFVDEVDLSGLGFKTEPADTGRPGYHPEMMLKLFIYGYMNRVGTAKLTVVGPEYSNHVDSKVPQHFSKTQRSAV